MLEGLKNTLLIAVIGLIIGIVLGTVIPRVAFIRCKYKVLPRVLNGICSFYVGLFRGTPMVVQLLVFYYVLLPIIGVKMTGVQVSMMVFGLNSAAYISEIMRSGIMSVDAGQLEAGRAVGLSFSVSMIKIVIPQAIKNILPALGNEMITLLKDTSLVSVIALRDVTKQAQNIVSNTYQAYVPYVSLAIIYLVLVIILTKLLGIFERRLRESDRR